jgi:hypothetical protein
MLTSPGLEIQVIDESQYLPAGVGTVPLIVLATATNKIFNGVVAPGTTKANAGRLNAVSSQRELVSDYGLPIFRQSAIGTPLHGDPLNEYGLMAAYSALGLGNRAFIIRADIDLNEIRGSASRPVGQPADGTYWLDLAETTWGIFEWSAATQTFAVREPLLVTAVADLVQVNGVDQPADSVGAVGNYAVVLDRDDNVNRVFYKTRNNVWVEVGSQDWQDAIPAVVGTVASPSLTTGNEIRINSIPVELTGTGTLADLVNDINGANILGVTAGIIDNKLALFVNATATSTGQLVDGTIEISNDTGDILGDVGITAGAYRSPAVHIGQFNQIPSWKSFESDSRPGNSVWFKLGAVGGGANISVKRYNANTASWVPESVPLYDGELDALAGLDFNGGGINIAPDTIYAAYDVDATKHVNVQLYRRSATGAVSVSATTTTPLFNSGDTFTINVSQPRSSVYSSYTVVMNGTNSTAFVQSVQAAAIPGLEARVDINGDDHTITLTHTVGGYINLLDITGSAVDTAGFTQSLPAHYPVPLRSGLVNNPFSLANIDLFDNAGGNDYTVGPTEPGVAVDGDRWFDTTNGREYTYDIGTQSWLLTGSPAYIASTTAPGSPSLGDKWYRVNEDRVYVWALQGATARWIEVWSAGNRFAGVSVSGFEPLTYAYSATNPVTDPADGALWYYSLPTEVDILINDNGWRGYRNVSADARGYNLTQTNPTGPLVSASEPTEQSDGTPLVPGDLWIDTGDLVNYPRIYRYDGSDWNLIDNSDQVSSDGIAFADVRWGTSGNVDPASGAIPSITALSVSDYIDIDAPDFRLFPRGMIVFNMRRSGFNIKRYVVNYFNSASFPDSVLPAQRDAWVTASGLKLDGSMYAGPQAQRNMVVSAMKSALDSNVDVREDQFQFNLMAAPGYPELISNLVGLNNDRANTAFVIGDTPIDLGDRIIDIINWSNNARGDGLSIADVYLGVFYPAGLSNDLEGNSIVVPASHMILRTVMRSDNISFPWFAPAGARRGLVDNAESLGYIDSDTGEFVRFGVSKSLRDTLYENRINPLTVLPGTGLLNYGQKTRSPTTSALDRINVARLINYIRTVLQPLANNFLFEPNDQVTRNQVKQSVEGIMNDLVAKRALYDFLVVCDDSNNTPDRISRNELYIDIAIAPVRSIEFIYIPLRIRNPGDI